MTERYNIPICLATRPPPRGRHGPAPLRLACGASLALHVALLAGLTLSAGRPPVAELTPPATLDVLMETLPPSPVMAMADAPTPDPADDPSPPSPPPQPVAEAAPMPEPPIAPPPPPPAELPDDAAPPPPTVVAPPPPPPPPTAAPLVVPPPVAVPRPVRPQAAVPAKPVPSRPAPRPPPRATDAGPPQPQPQSESQPQPAASAPTATAAAIDPAWRGAVAAWLAAHKTFPEEARLRRESGRAVIRFTMAPDGRVRRIELVQSTGSAVLDSAVQDLLRTARLPPFPAGMTQPEVTLTIGIQYTLAP